MSSIQRELEQRRSAASHAARYGVCRECGGAIAKARLTAMPFATRCVACQARLEGLERAA
jgi:DnaK suppressor protein